MNRITATIFPPRCPYCSKLLRYDMTECLLCRAQFPKQPRIELTPTGEICISPLTYDAKVRKAILDYKFHGKTFNAESLSAAMAAAVKRVYYKDMSFEVITCVPMSKDRRKRRGYNQSELIARNVAKLLDKPFEELMYRDSGAEQQHNLNAYERINNRDMTYHVIDPEKIKGKKILIIDDVMTTGATLSNCSKILKEQGAERVLCAVAAITVK